MSLPAYRYVYDLLAPMLRAMEASQACQPVRAGKRLAEAHAVYATNAREWEIAGHGDFTRRAAELLSALDRALRLLWDKPEDF